MGKDGGMLNQENVFSNYAEHQPCSHSSKNGIRDACSTADCCPLLKMKRQRMKRQRMKRQRIERQRMKRQRMKTAISGWDGYWVMAMKISESTSS